MKAMQEQAIIPKSKKGQETQPLWDVFEAMAADGARYKRHVVVTKTSIRASGDDPVYRLDLSTDAGGYRHEWGTLMKVEERALQFLDHHPEAEHRVHYDLYLHLIASHHGYFRPSMPDRGFDSPPTPAKQNPLRLECIERAARLQKQLGYWRLAYLESLLKIADVAASRNTEYVPFEGADNLDEA